MATIVLTPAKDFGLRGMDLLALVMETIEDNPEHWKQNSWAFAGHSAVMDLNYPPCGTSGCAAGWATMLCGVKLRSDFALLGDPYHLRRTIAGYSVASEAADLMGLTSQEADELFDGGNSLADLRRIASVIAAKRGVILFEDDD
jgi:hypothetical protein